LHKIAEAFPAFNLELEMVDSWIAEIDRVDAIMIPVSSSITIEVLASFESLNTILMEYMTASGSSMRVQALKLLEYLLTNAERYNLFQNPRVYFNIGRWVERLSLCKDNEQGE
jgi:hypothetical protein